MMIQNYDAAHIPAFIQAQWQDIIKRGQPLSFKAGQVLFYEGHEPYGLFVILSGKVAFTNLEFSCREESWRTPEGEVVGLGHLSPGAKFCCTGTAVSDCEVLFISKTEIEQVLSKKGDLS